MGSKASVYLRGTWCRWSYTYIHTHIHTHYIRTHINTHIHTHIHTYIHTHISVPIVESNALKGERLIKGYMVSSVNEWGADQTRVLLVTNEAVHRVKYNFNTDVVLKWQTGTHTHTYSRTHARVYAYTRVDIHMLIFRR